MIQSGRFWAWVPAGLLVCMLGGLGTMATLAVRDPGFALEPDYYAKAVAYDREIAQRVENTRLSWSLDTTLGPAGASADSPLVVRVAKDEAPIEGARVHVTALRNAGASLILETALIEASPGEYRAALPLRVGGIWELRFRVERGIERFTSVARQDVPDLMP